VGAVKAVAVVEVGDVADGREPAVRVTTQVRGQRRQPWLAQALVDDIEEGPNGALR
jgi:hypothetical protein